jgi:hypothetical protein
VHIISVMLNAKRQGIISILRVGAMTQEFYHSEKYLFHMKLTERS